MDGMAGWGDGAQSLMMGGSMEGRGSCDGTEGSGLRGLRVWAHRARALMFCQDPYTLLRVFEAQHARTSKCSTLVVERGLSGVGVECASPSP